MRNLTLATLLSLFASLSAAADVLKEIDTISYNRPVIDQARVFSRDQQRSLGQLLAKIYRDTKVQIGVVSLVSLENHAIESISIRIAEKWQLGSADEDNGVLILIAKNDRQVRIEVGQGLEGALTDAYSKRIIDYALIPNFKNGDFFGGVLSGVESILGYVAPDYDLVKENPTVTTRKSARSGPSLFNIIFGFLALAFLLFTRVGRLLLVAMLVNGRGGMGSRGGGYGGGGGGFSGGGASGSW